MTALIPVTMPLGRPFEDAIPNEPELAAAAFWAATRGGA